MLHRAALDRGLKVNEMLRQAVEVYLSGNVAETVHGDTLTADERRYLAVYRAAASATNPAWRVLFQHAQELLASCAHRSHDDGESHEDEKAGGIARATATGHSRSKRLK